jgi:hypothetical protein
MARCINQGYGAIMSKTVDIDAVLRQTIVNEIEFREKQVKLLRDSILNGMADYHQRQLEDAQHRLDGWDRVEKELKS